ncbi:hypothetical protein Pth03_59490 [Planotetraspora thailandica]|uniref:DUF2637 domain-containing protein n=1 Tax=Planotetraspora thailandica TaxID=487172 RepID=A0A8J3XYL7_9ACTN|nr:DUF2637 domain-containing protein [Planotetraspora thailandica]GII57560.1 hypothetical protein Pth03_59490 [Planotetraspora thailandica]
MDATPPGAAGIASRPSTTTPAVSTHAATDPAGSAFTGIPLVLRRLAIGLAALIVAVLAGAACALSFDDIRALAITGQARPHLSYLYPTAFDALLVLSLVTIPLLRGGRLLVRAQAALVFVVLLATAGAATVATATHVVFDIEGAAIVVGLVPWVMLVIGLWMLLLLLKHARASRADLDGTADPGDIVPFIEDRHPHPVGGPTAPYPALPGVDASPEQAPPLPAIPSAAHQLPSDDAITGHLEADEPTDTPADEPTDAPPGTPADEPVRTTSDAGPAPEALPVVPPTAAPKTPVVSDLESAFEDDRPAPSRPNRPNRPIRWGDFVRPHTGDVLVHPRTPATPPSPVQASPAEPNPAELSPVVDASPAAEPNPAEVTPVADVSPAEQGLADPGPADAPAARGGTENDSARPSAERQDFLQTIEAALPDPAATNPVPAPVTIESPRIETPQIDAAEIDAAEVDTQPLRQIKAVPDPAHTSELADPEEHAEAEQYSPEIETVPAGGEEPPPSGRLRSTPLPPK